MSYSLKRRVVAGSGAFAIAVGMFFTFRNTPPINPELAAISKRVDSLVVQALIIESEDKNRTKEVLSQVLPGLRALPRNLVGRVQFEEEEERVFFRKHLPLYFSLERLHKMKQFLSEAIQFEKDLFNPLSTFQGKRLKEPEMDFDSLGDSLIDIRPLLPFQNGQYVSQDGKKRAVLIFAGPEFSKNVGEVRKRITSILNTIASKHSDVRIRLAPHDDSEIKMIFKGSPAPFVYFANSRDGAKAFAGLARALPNVSVKTLANYIPTEQKEKIRLLRSMKKLLSPDVIEVFGSEEKKWARRFLETEVHSPLEEKDLPLSVRSRFKDKEKGSTGTIVYVYPSNQDRAKVKKQLENLAGGKTVLFDARFP